ncbi:unnamed protein product [Brassicogethes aeneus]|uniref:C2HC/C3H-type domain-containing protein n=1 Tax=Brassicogethes aeneus TaxID=1431903 RepID=A0A9P0BKU6_BRAAE|nr:unnamed protein product [Brassicogethes aeneus]
MFKSLLPWKHKHNKIKVMAAVSGMENEVTTQSQHLAPCQTCGRTFLPSPLRKHEKICQKNAAKKRRVFNSLKQRVEGTDLAAFHMNQVLKPVLCQPPPQETHKPKPSKWKEKHLELVTAIRAARGAADDSPGSTAKRATGIGAGNERCPSCDRQFGPKAFDRHVEWCKEHKARIQKSPASNLAAKERLEARTKYRVPPLNKSKRSLTREKYKESPTSINSPEVKSYSTTTLSRTPSIRKPNSVANVRKKPEEKMPALEKHQLQPAKVEGTKSVKDKKGLPILKKQMSFEPTPKPVLKSKEDVNNYFNNTRGTPDKEVIRSEESLKPEDLFAVDDEMFEEYKKYEEMYLKEKEKGSVSNKKCKPKLENFGILTASEDEHSPQITNLANDSAYGSLQRKTPKHRSRAAKLAPLEPPKRPDSTSSSGSEQIAPKECNQKLSKFCHECGNKYPVTSAKFCVECGVKRLIL